MPTATTTGSNAGTTSASIWPSWFNTTAATTTGIWGAWTTGGVWTAWTTTNATTIFPPTAATGWVDTRTPEQIAADEERRRVERAQTEERLARERADHEQAVQRAETLLHENLSIRQRRTLRTHQTFRVRARSGRRYEITRGHHANIYQLDDAGRRTHRLCVYPQGGLPDADCMLAQKLWLEANEEGIRRVANITPLVVAG